MSAYSKPLPYRKSQPYRGVPAIPPVPINAATYGDRWQGAEATNRQHAVTLPAATHRDETVRALFGTGQAYARELATPLHQLGPHAIAERIPWETLEARSRDEAAPFNDAAPHQRESSVVWADFTGKHASTSTEPWVQPDTGEISLAAAWGALQPHQRTLSAMWHKLVAHGAMVALPWSPIGSRSAYIGIGYPVEPPGPTGGPDGDAITVPIQAVYIMIPTLEAVLLPDNVPIPLLSATITGDVNSWAWTFSAAMAASGLSLVNPADSDVPAEIAITINGYTWIFRVEGVDDNRRFGSKTMNIRGRSRSADLAFPYAQVRTYTETSDLNASQLATNEITPHGWTLVWNTVDWLVPGGTFSYQDLAPIDALSRVAASVGASVLSDPSALNLTIQPQYPISPWAWGATTPYAILPSSIITQGDGSWQGGTNATGVYVYAENAGYGALVKLTGSDGAHQIPMVVERLTVSADPVRELGRVALSRAGRIKTESRVIPLFPAPAAPGLIPLGSVLEITDSETETWRGQVMSVQISAQRAGSATSVRQTLGLQRQFRDPGLGAIPEDPTVVGTESGGGLDTELGGHLVTE